MYDCFLLGLTRDNMTGITCEAGNAYSSGAPDFTLQWRVHVVPFLFTDFANVRTSVLSVNDFGFGCFDIWTTFNVDECILGWGSNVVCIWIWIKEWWDERKNKLTYLSFCMTVLCIMMTVYCLGCYFITLTVFFIIPTVCIFPWLFLYDIFCLCIWFDDFIWFIIFFSTFPYANALFWICTLNVHNIHSIWLHKMK